MSEQQRVFLAVFACVGILLVWQVLAPPPVPRTAPPEREAAGAAESATAQPTSPGAVAAEATKPEGAGEGEGAAPAEQASAVAAVALRSVTFETPLFEGEITNEQLALTRLDLLHYDERRDGDEALRAVGLVSPDVEGTAGQAAVLWQIDGAAAPRMSVREQGGAVVFEGATAAGVGTRATVTPRQDAYALDYALRLENRTGRAVQVGAGVRLALETQGGGGGFLSPPRDQLFGACGMDADIERVLAGDADEAPWKSPTPVSWAGVDRQYFVVAAVPQEGDSAGCAIDSGEASVKVDLSFPTQSIAAGGVWQKSFSVFLGPKRQERLAAVSPRLPDVIDYDIWNIPLGFLARPMVFLMNAFHGWTGSWGVAIMLLTLVVKLLLFPVTYKSVVSMRKMQLLKPELDRIKKQFENDRERQQMEQLKLFREKGVNPLGGCLPMLLQMPVWFALYRTLWTAVDLYQQPFLWLDDLTAKEPFPFLALALGGLTYVQQKITPMAADNQQAKMMLYLMPVMLTVFMIALPSGLVLYILVNSVLTIVQQVAINKRQSGL